MLEGSCACGKARYQVEGAVEEAHHCHCSLCRKSHGAAFATYARVRSSALRIASGSDELAVFRSTPPVRRTYCRSCGSPLFFAHEAAPQFVWIAAGTLDATPLDASAAIRPDAHTFVRSKAGFWPIDDELLQYDAHRPGYG